ncbi:PSP1 C-terminal conserved region-domain-containing protein [Radiomyces spectabilis]|uniref:PSP1 C-terminal conserved region-domain-containing protein n=1 Tax=Radiomyces spectabilis TaxID=64574 RepID=UPI0022201029|nr:PSP1 C-terminal conserved region-domain-containing protein [Radiomyces spectabilis]KAI8369265.1 PSP1 C-terminal conserved region-domain-containing protein [Radiomyces spectabilis]
MNPANATPVNYSSDVSCQTVGKGVSLQHFVDSGIPLYKVAFKAGRSELCYLSDKDAWIRLPKMGDLVIIEADRGRDLGTIVADRVNASELCGKEEIMSPPADPLSVTDTGRINPKDVYVKQMFRLAESAEIASLATKSQDEAKALLVCQAKIKQKGLCMEVLNAEYQWDRRKLTFYFVADQRIDFRELVRELFKIYKTRIWMCATKPV